MNDGVRAVLVGCGGISGAWLKSFPGIPGLRIVGYVDLDPDAARRRKDEFGPADAEVGTDLASMLDRTRPDAVFDCTVPEAHRSVVLTALRAGLPRAGREAAGGQHGERAGDGRRRRPPAGRTR